MPLRLAILGSSPCHACTAACCRQNGHAFAALLVGDEVRRFRPFSQTAAFRDSSGAVSTEHVLPYVNGKCQFLGDDNRCTVYEDRPQSCRGFECVHHLDAGGEGVHGPFLEMNPGVLKMLVEEERATKR